MEAVVALDQGTTSSRAIVISLVMEALGERGLLKQNAPHLVRDLAFVVPSYEWWESPFYGVGLKVYDLLAGRYGFGRSRHLSRRQVIESIPSIQTAALSRDHAIMIDPESGLLTVAGGKWTTYRKMAEDVVDQVAVLGGLPQTPCATASLRVHGYCAPAESTGRLFMGRTPNPSTLCGRIRRWPAPSTRTWRPPALRWSGPAAARWRVPSTTCWRGVPAPCSWTSAPPPRLPKQSRRLWRRNWGGGRPGKPMRSLRSENWP